MEREAEAEMLPLHSEFGPSSFQPYVLDLGASGLAGEEVFTLAILVMRRNGGLLMALPELVLPA